MTTGITPAALKPALPAATGGDTAAAAKAAGFSEWLDRPAGGRTRQSAHSSPSSPASAKPERRHEETTPKDGTSGELPQPLPLDGPDKQAVGSRSAMKDTPPTRVIHADKDGETADGTEQKKSDPEDSKHKAVTVDVSAILFGLTGAAANTAPSGGGDPSATSPMTGSAGQSAEAAATAAGRKGGSPAPATANTDLQMATVQANDATSADTMASAAKRQSAASGAPPAAMRTGESNPTGGAPTSAHDDPSVDVTAAAQPVSSAKVQGVTVTASATIPATPPVVTGQPAKAETDKASDIASAAQDTGTEADPADMRSDTASRPMSVPPARSSGGDTGRDAGSNRHDGGKDPAGSASPALRNAGSTQTAGSAIFSGGGTTAPFLSQTASSFVAGMGTPQTWAATVSQTAYMAYTPAMTAPVRSLSIALQPAELGTVTANLHLSGQQLRVDVEVRTEEARQRLSSDADDIVKSLRNLGFDVSHITIRHGGNATPLATGAGQAAGQPQGNAAFQASANSGGGHGGTTEGNAGKNDANQEPQIAVARPSGSDGLSRGLYI